MKKIKFMLIAITLVTSILLVGCQKPQDVSVGSLSISFDTPGESKEEEVASNEEAKELTTTMEKDTKDDENTTQKNTTTAYVAKVIEPARNKADRSYDVKPQGGDVETVQWYSEQVTSTTQAISTTGRVSDWRAEDQMIQNGEFYCRYTIKQGETYQTLWYNFLVTQNQICAFNGINPNEFLQAGWVIYIPLDTYQPPEWWPYDYVPEWSPSYGNYDYPDGNSWNGWSESYTDAGSWNEWSDTWENSWSAPENSYEDSWSCNSGYSDGYVSPYTVTLWTTNSEWGSWYNIKLAASMLNGYCMEPGESFSWFVNMGPCQYDQGFVDGGAYTAGGSAPGGGICFVSTALMQGARGAGCVITERYDHAGYVSYAIPGDEAAVSWGECNLRFYNPSSTTGLKFSVYADEYSQSITVSVSTY